MLLNQHGAQFREHRGRRIVERPHYLLALVDLPGRAPSRRGGSTPRDDRRVRCTRRLDTNSPCPMTRSSSSLVDFGRLSKERPFPARDMADTPRPIHCRTTVRLAALRRLRTVVSGA
jgi:hypothetical protein